MPVLAAVVVAAAGTLVLQLVEVRPALTRRADAVLAGADAPRSRAHLAYIALEAVKVVALIALGSTAFAAASA